MSVDKAVDSTVLDGYFSGIADAIRDKNGSQSTYTPSQMPQAIENIPSGGGDIVKEKDVNFYDYDGSVVASYTAEEFASLEALPSNPSHTGLTAQGWNWTLVDAKTYVAKMGILNIGQMYVTTSGDTEIDIELREAGRLGPSVGLYLNGEVQIDWGDNSTDTLSGSSLSTRVKQSHTYASAGEYTIKIHIVSGSYKIAGTGTSNVGSQFVFNGSSATSENTLQIYQNAVNAIRLGNNVIISDYAFMKFWELKTITIPSTISGLGNNAFNECFSLTHVTLPNGILTLGLSVFEKCRSLDSLALPNGITSIEAYAFRNCTLLRTVTFPNSVISVGTQAIKGWQNIQVLGLPCVDIDAYGYRDTYSLKKVAIPENITVGGQAFYECFLLESVKLNQGCSFGTYEFRGSTAIQKINIPNDMNTIPIGMFYGCKSLETVDIPDSVTTIESYAFEECRSLVSVTIPETVTNIGSSAFYDCKSISVITFLPEAPPALGDSSVFAGLPSSKTVYVPHGTLETYKAASGYSALANDMVELPA